MRLDRTPAPPLVLDSAGPLAVDIGVANGSSHDRGICAPNQYNTYTAAVHRLITGELAPPVSMGVLGAQVLVDYTVDSGTKGCDFAAIDAEANCQTDGTTSWWATAECFRGEATISGGVTHGSTRGILAETRQTFEGTFTGVTVTQGSTTVVLPVGQSTSGMKAILDAGGTVWIGDAASDVLQDNTTVTACDPDGRTFTLSQPATYTVTETLTWTRSDGVLLAAEIGVLNYASTTHSVLPISSSVWTKEVLALTSRGTFPAAAFIANHVNKAGAYDGIYFQQVCENFAHFLNPGRPGCVGMRLDPSTLSFNGCYVQAGVTTVTRPTGATTWLPFDISVFAHAKVGMRVWGQGIHGNTYITAVSDDYKTITLSRAAYATFGTALLGAVTLVMSNWSAGVLLPDEIPIQALDSDLVTLRDLIKLDGNQVRLGDTATEVTISNNVNLRGMGLDGVAYTIARVAPSSDVVLGSSTLTGQKLILNPNMSGGVRFGSGVGSSVFWQQELFAGDGPSWYGGTVGAPLAGSPEAHVTAPVGSLALKSAGVGTVYVKASGAGNTGWLTVPAGTPQSSSGETAGYATGSGGASVNVGNTFTGNVGSTGYTVGDIVKALKNFGVLAQ